MIGWLDEAEQLATALLLADLAKAQKLDRERSLVVKARTAIARAVKDFLEQLGKDVAGVARKFGKAGADDKDDPATAAASAEYDALGEEIAPDLREVAKDAARLGLDQVEADLERLLDQANDRAIAWADARAAELVTEISETTCARVRELVEEAVAEGWSNDELADAIAADGVFGDARAELIARTETAMADVQGNLIGWKQSGVVEGKEWIVAQDGECDECAAMAGEVVPLDAEFSGGDPPLHPRCRCDLLPVLPEEADGEEAEE